MNGSSVMSMRSGVTEIRLAMSGLKVGAGGRRARALGISDPIIGIVAAIVARVDTQESDRACPADVTATPAT